MSATSKIRVGGPRKQTVSQKRETFTPNSDSLNMRYKLSQPEIIFLDDESPQPCVDRVIKPDVRPIVKEVMSALALKIARKENGLKSTAPACVHSGRGVLSPELKRQEFMAYLRKSGFIKSITKVVIAFCELEELPSRAKGMALISETLGYGLTVAVKTGKMKAEKECLQKRISILKNKIDMLQRFLDEVESTMTEIEELDAENSSPMEMLEESHIIT